MNAGNRPVSPFEWKGIDSATAYSGPPTASAGGNKAAWTATVNANLNN
jgi:hypothetical protein